MPRPRRRREDMVRQAKQALPADPAPREKLLELAGFYLRHRAEIIKRAINTQVAALDATRQTRHGEAPDWDARLRASDALQHLFGAVPSRTGSGGAPTTAVQLVVELPAFAQSPARRGADLGFPVLEAPPGPDAPDDP